MTELSDRELDVYLAGAFDLIERECDRCDTPAGWSEPDEHGTRFGWGASSTFGRHFHMRDGSQRSHLPAYSSTGDGMLLVIEAMRGRGWDWSLWGGLSVNAGNPNATFTRDGETADSYAFTLPRAVAEAARAALLAGVSA